jgi:antitoxin ParD1/3/4
MAVLTIEIPDQLEQFIEENVASGSYATREEFVRSALLDLKHRDEEELEKFRSLREAIEIGLASGVAPGSTKEVFERAKQRALARTAS